MSNIKIYGRLENFTSDGILAGANQINDDNLGKKQTDINQDFTERITNLETNSNSNSIGMKDGEGEIFNTYNGNDKNSASALGSHAEGIATQAKNIAEHAEGKYNMSHTNDSDDSQKTIHSIGIGSSDSNRMNAVEVMNNGDIYIKGIGNFDGSFLTASNTLQNVINNSTSIAYFNGIVDDVIMPSSTALSGTKLNVYFSTHLGCFVLKNNLNYFSTWDNSYLWNKNSGSETTAYQSYLYIDHENNIYIFDGTTLQSLITNNESGSINVVQTTGTSQTNVMSQKAVSDQIKTTNSILSQKQDALVSGITIKTINNQSVLGKGNISLTNEGNNVGAFDSANGGDFAEIFNDYEKNKAFGNYSHAEGENTIASDRSSHTEGIYTITSNNGEHAEGSYNKSHSDSEYTSGLTIHSIGIGFSESLRKNAVEVMLNGDVYINNIGNYDGSNIDNAQTIQAVINNIKNNSSSSLSIVQTTGTSQTNVMSQNAVSEEISKTNDTLVEKIDNSEKKLFFNSIYEATSADTIDLTTEIYEEGTNENLYFYHYINQSTGVTTNKNESFFALKKDNVYYAKYPNTLDYNKIVNNKYLGKEYISYIDNNNVLYKYINNNLSPIELINIPIYNVKYISSTDFKDLALTLLTKKYFILYLTYQNSIYKINGWTQLKTDQNIMIGKSLTGDEYNILVQDNGNSTIYYSPSEKIKTYYSEYNSSDFTDNITPLLLKGNPFILYVKMEDGKIVMFNGKLKIINMFLTSPFIIGYDDTGSQYKLLRTSSTLTITKL